MKSILFISVMNGSGWGGSEEQWYQAAYWMSSNGYRVGVCVFDRVEKKPKLDLLEKNGCRIYLLPYKGSGIFSSWKKRQYLHKIPFHEYDAAYVNQGGWHDIAHGPFKKLYKKLPPYALSFHNYQLGAGLKSSTVSTLKAWISHAAFCNAATGIIFQMLENEYGIKGMHKEVTYSPITFPAPDKLPGTSYGTTKRVFLALGALDTNRKAQDVLIKCLAGNQWKNRDWVLHIYGEGKDKAMLAALIKELNLEEKIFLKGHTNEVKRVLAESDLLIQATHFDAMPISVIEAMAMGKPCLVSHVGDMPEWIKPGYNGFITSAVNEKDLGDQLEIAWTKKDNWAKMGEHAYAVFLEKYPQPYEEKFVALLKKHIQTL